MLVGKLRRIFEIRRVLCPLKIIVAASGMDQDGCLRPTWQVCYLHGLRWCGQAYPSWILPLQFSWQH